MRPTMRVTVNPPPVPMWQLGGLEVSHIHKSTRSLYSQAKRVHPCPLSGLIDRPLADVSVCDWMLMYARVLDGSSQIWLGTE